MKAFKRSLFGYRRAEVERALMARDTALAEGAEVLARETTELAGARIRIAQLEAVCDALSDRVVARDRELDELRAELGRALARAERNEAVGAQAREQATRMRMAALRDAAEVSSRLRELSEAPMAARGRLAESLRAAIERCGEGDAPRENGSAPRDQADAIFEGLVEVEVGPLDDFSQLVGFEDAAGAIGATSEISVRRFARGRATLEMKLAEPVELLRELEERAPFEFRVRDRRFDRLVLDVEAE
ncbi:MAG: hypothetical protein ABWZ43_03665 [Solirubrobacterales bacterium]